MKIRQDNNGLHLFERSTGLNVLLEGSVAGPIARAPRHLSIALTNACDLRCAYCYAPKTPAHLDRADLERWLRELDIEGCLGIGFGGGEPTLYPGFSSVCRWTATNTNLAVTFTTHAHRLTDELCEELAGSVHFVRVSMDGVGATYGRLRGRSFEDLLAALSRLRRISHFGINVVVNDDTIEELDEVAEVASAAGADELLLLPQQATTCVDGVSARLLDRLGEWIRQTDGGPLRLAISERGAVEGVPLARAFCDPSLLDSHVHLDASGLLKASSFDLVGEPVGHSLIEALRRLRTAYGAG